MLRGITRTHLLGAPPQVKILARLFRPRWICLKNIINQTTYSTTAYAELMKSKDAAKTEQFCERKQHFAARRQTITQEIISQKKLSTRHTSYYSKKKSITINLTLTVY